MGVLLQRIHDIGARAWLQFLQSLNWIMVSLLGGAYVVNETYPDVVRSQIAKLPAYVGIPAILIFGVIVHYAARRAKKAAGG